MSTSLYLEDSPTLGEGLTACRLCGESSAWRLPKMRQGPLIYRCGRCGVSFASHPQKATSAVTVQDHFGGIDKEMYFRSVMATRLRSYTSLVNRVKEQVPSGKWLDVGCSYGWLLKYVNEQGYEEEGIEPSVAAAASALQQSLRVRTGLFPAALDENEQFDVISFMDVLEHFENPTEALAATRNHLSPDGVVVIQVPDQACWLFRIAEAMYRFSGGRISFALRRLWLDGFDFPHQFYFTRQTLELLLHKNGFEVLDSRRTSIGHPAEALNRVAYAERSTNHLRTTAVGMSVGLINAVDNACGHGGLLSVIATPQ